MPASENSAHQLTCTCPTRLVFAFRTTYIYPAEVFPTRFKAFAHGMSAACGKAGAIISALAFNSLSKSIGTPAVLWSTYLNEYLHLVAFTETYLSISSLLRLLCCRCCIHVPSTRSQDARSRRRIRGGGAREEKIETAVCLIGSNYIVS